MTEAPEDAHDRLERMVEEVTLDEIFAREPSQIAPEALAAWVERERRRRAEFIAKGG